MTTFVDECRREWKRLGVPEAVADDMAAELEADLREAEAEGASAADVLGPGVLDPRSFAASWATERGVVSSRANRGRLPLALAAFVTVVAAVMIGASVAILTSSSDELAFPPPPNLVRGPAPVLIQPPTDGLWVIDDGIVRTPSDDDLDPVGWLLLGVGLVTLVPAGLLWLSRRGGRAPVAPT